MSNLIPNHDQQLDYQKNREEDRRDAIYWATEGLARAEHDICQGCSRPFGDEMPDCPNVMMHYPNEGEPTGKGQLEEEDESRDEDLWED